MLIATHKCQECGQEQVRVSFENTACSKDLCCNCCEKQGGQPLNCRISHMELQRIAEGKELNEHDVKGILLERPVSDTLNALGIHHTHNPFTNAYPCFQNKGPDIAIEKISTVIECKNLSETQVKHLSKEWLDENIIERPYFAKYKRKIAVFSYKPRIQLIRYLNKYGWRVYSLNKQLLTSKQAIRARSDLIKKFHWLKKEYNENRL